MSISTHKPQGWCTAAELGHLLGISTQAVRQSYVANLPPDDVDRTVKPMLIRFAGVLALLVERESKGRPDDPLLSGVDSPGLERYRMAKAEHAELDLAMRRGDLIEREKCRGVLTRWAIPLRRHGERIGRQYGPHAADDFNRTLDECERIVDELGSHDGD